LETFVVRGWSAGEASPDAALPAAIVVSLADFSNAVSRHLDWLAAFAAAHCTASPEQVNEPQEPPNSPATHCGDFGFVLQNSVAVSAVVFVVDDVTEAPPDPPDFVLVTVMVVVH
jgi:hypothetical protein